MGGARPSPMRGKVLYINPASRPATSPPDMAVVKTRMVRKATDFRRGEKIGEERLVSVVFALAGLWRRRFVVRMERPFQSMAE